MHLEVCCVNGRSMQTEEVCFQSKSYKIGAELVSVGFCYRQVLGLGKISVLVTSI